MVQGICWAERVRCRKLLDMCGIITVGEWFNDFGRKFRYYGRVEEGPKDLLGEVRDNYRAVSGEPIFRF